MNVASYVNSTTFQVTGNRTMVYQAGLKMLAYMGSGGNLPFTVVSSSYSLGVTTIVVKDNILLPSLIRVGLGSTIPANTGEHYHTGPHDAGYLAASRFSEARVDVIETIASPVTGDAHKVVAVAPTESAGYILAALTGVTNRLTITRSLDGTTVTFSIPQDIHTGASPTFAGMTLTGLTGVLVGAGASAVAAVGPGGSLTVLRRNADNTAWECALVNLGDLGDSLLTSVAAGDMILRNDSSKWINMAKGADNQALIVNATTHFPAWATLVLTSLSDWPAGVSATELSYLDGVTSAIQGQIDAKEASNSLKLKQTIATLTDAADITPDFSASNNFQVTIADNRNFKNPTSPTVGQRGTIYVIQGTGGSRLLTWDTYYKFSGGAPTLSTTEGAIDAIDFRVRTATNIVCNFLGNIGA